MAVTTVDLGSVRGPEGPNQVSGTTDTTLSGLLKGSGGKVMEATPGRDYVSGNDYTHLVTPKAIYNANTSVYTLTLNPPLSTYIPGTLLVVDFNEPSKTPVPQLNINGLGNKYVIPFNSTYGPLFSAGVHPILFDGEAWRLMDAFFSKMGGAVTGSIHPDEDKKFYIGSENRRWHSVYTYNLDAAAAVTANTGTFANGLTLGGKTMADFVVTQGTSGIWTYRTWKSGVKECWGVTSQSFTLTKQYGGFYVMPSAQQITLPFTLTETDKAGVSVNCSNAVFATDCSASGNTISVSVASGISRTETVKLRMYVIGK